MNILTILVSFLVTVPAFAESWESLQSAAEEKFIGESKVETKVGPHPATIVEVEFKSPVSRIELNRIDNPLFKATKAYTEYAFSLVKDVDFVEVYLYAGNESLNCYATFENGVFRDLSKCSKISYSN